MQRRHGAFRNAPQCRPPSGVRTLTDGLQVQRQTEALDRRSRRFGPPKEARRDAAEAAGTPDPQKVLEKFLADLRARMQERKERERDAQGGSGDGGAGSRNGQGFRSVTADP